MSIGGAGRAGQLRRVFVEDSVVLVCPVHWPRPGGRATSSLPNEVVIGRVFRFVHGFRRFSHQTSFARQASHARHTGWIEFPVEGFAARRREFCLSSKSRPQFLKLRSILTTFAPMNTDRTHFLALATLVQGAVAILAFGLAWLLKINPLDHFHWTARAVVSGIVGTLPMLGLFALSWKLSWKALRDIREFLIEALGPMIAACRWYDLVWVALLAGCSEELLFRGVLQVSLSLWGITAGLVLSNLLFGLAHAVTKLYLLLAALLGVYLGLLFHSADGNLVTPILTHALYDLVAFFVVKQEFLKRSKSANATIADQSEEPGEP